jgi:predicted Zn-dependent protease with MMP-like domain
MLWKIVFHTMEKPGRNFPSCGSGSRRTTPWKTVASGGGAGHNGGMNVERLERMAQAEVAALRRALPPEMAGRAAAVPVVCLPRPTKAMVREDGLDADLLGLFVGPNLAEGVEGGDPLPPEILLFLENLWDFAEGDEDAFREEVRVTYFHELGHYLGLEEGDLEDRGLE